jgi:uncharacterized protein
MKISRAAAYLTGICISEAASVILPTLQTGWVTLGLSLYAALFMAMILDAANIKDKIQSKFVLSLALVPLIRIFSLILPLTQIPQIWWYPLIYAPLLAAAVAMAYILDYRPSDIGLSLRNWPRQLLIPFLGFGLGFLEYSILAPQPLVAGLTWHNALLPAVLLFVSTGVVEELIFRGVLQKSAGDFLEGRGIVYVAVIFAILHVGWAVGPGATSWAMFELVFVFGVALLFGWIVKKTGSLLGVILCHGVINVVLFIIMPLWLR